MVIYYLNIRYIAIVPFKNNSPLVIYSYGVKITSSKQFKSIPRGHPKIVYRNCGMDLHKLPSRCLLNFRWEFFGDDHPSKSKFRPGNQGQTYESGIKVGEKQSKRARFSTRRKLFIRFHFSHLCIMILNPA
jgi:hypothetical protein